MLTARSLEVSAGRDAVKFCHAQGWTDGLRVGPAAGSRVMRVPAGTKLPAEETVVWLPPAVGRLDLPRGLRENP